MTKKPEVPAMLHRLLHAVETLIPLRTVSAHCDIPCGIYDPHLAQLAAHTVVRMVQLINELPKPGADATGQQRQEFVHKMARATATKDEHAELVKHEVRIIWGDFFKPEHLKQFPELHELVWQIMKLASKARQETGMEPAQELLANVQRFAEIFWKAKGIEPVRAKAPYPGGGELVLPRP